jgi:drug/metabolite transporter (DMT)-like permease
MEISNKSLALFSLGFVSFLYVLSSVAVRFLSFGFQPFTQVYVRMGLAFLLSLIVFGNSISLKRCKKISRNDWLLLIGMGTIGYGLAVDFVTLGVLHTKLLNVAVMGSTVPIFTFIYSLIFLRKHTSKILLLLIIISIYGVCVIATKSLIPVLSNFGIGEIYALLFAAGLGGYSICRRFLSKSISSKEITMIVIFFSFLSSLIVALIMRESISVGSFSKPIVLLGLGMGVAFNIINTQLENFSFKYVKPVIGTQFLLLENVFAPVLGYIIFGERVLPIEIFGAIIIIACVLLANKYSPAE